MRTTGKERFDLAFSHTEGPLLLDLGGLPTTGIHCATIEALRRYYGLEQRPVEVLEPVLMLGKVEDDLRSAMGVDTLPLWNDTDMLGLSHQHLREERTPWGQTVLMPEGFCTEVLEDGSIGTFSQGDASLPPCAKMPRDGFYFDAIPKPADEDAEYEARDNFEEFQPITDRQLAALSAQADGYAGRSEAILGNFGGTGLGDIALVPGLGLKHPRGIRSVEEWYISIVARPDILHEIFAYQTEQALANLARIWDAVGDTVQMLYICGTDFGTQKSPFCSVETFRQLYQPYYRKINDWVHGHTSWKTFKHSCGNIYSLLPDIVESGFDAINPVQWTAEEMEPRRLKQEFGNDLVFWGGGVDTQNLLPFGSPEAVYRQTLECCRAFGRGGGFVFNPIHNIQPLVPPENIDAMLRAVRTFNGEA